MTLSLEPIEAEQPAHVVFDNASWRFYESLLREIGEGTTRVTYDQGRMEVMSPLPEHDKAKRLIGRLIETITFELDIPCSSYGSSTFKVRRSKVGLEPDECYYLFANEPLMRNKKRIDLKVDPPPDLVLEIDISYRAIKRESIYATMKVAEIWRYDGEKLESLHLGTDGEYKVMDQSRAFPFLTPAELPRFVEIAFDRGENAMIRAFRDWIQQLPRS